MTKNESGSTETLRPMVSHAQPLSVDETFEALVSQRRRDVIHCLRTYEDPMALAAIAEEIAVWETETDIARLSSEEVERIYASLYHAHIPKLADLDIVAYDRDRDTVALAENADHVESVLESVVG